LSTSGRSREVQQIQPEERHSWLGAQLDQVEATLLAAIQDADTKAEQRADKMEAKLSKLYVVMGTLATAIITILLQQLASGTFGT